MNADSPLDNILGAVMVAKILLTAAAILLALGQPTYAQNSLEISASYWHAFWGSTDYRSSTANNYSSQDFVVPTRQLHVGYAPFGSEGPKGVLTLGWGEANRNYANEDLAGSYSACLDYLASKFPPPPPPPFGGSYCNTTASDYFSRFDIDGQVKFPNGARGAWWSVGARYASVDLSTNWDNLELAGAHLNYSRQHYLAQVGFGITQLMGDTLQHEFFASINLLGGASKSVWKNSDSVIDDHTAATIGLDMQVGYKYNIDADGKWSASAAYRLLTLSDAQSWGRDGQEFVHGPQGAVSFKW